MVGSTENRSSEDEERTDIGKRLIGCLPCIIVGRLNRHADYHHVLEGGKRVSHQHGYTSCLYHHKGELTEPMSEEWHIQTFGPSYHTYRKQFRNFFGGEKALIKTMDYAVEMAKHWNWPDFEMPESAAKQIQIAHFSNRARC